MKKNLSHKERKQKSLYRNVAIAVLVVFILAGVLIATDDGPGPMQYTPEQMLHDHDGDGIPDH